MIKNIGNTDKMVRLILGIGLLSIGIYFKSWIGLLALIPLLTALLNICPLYLIFGINTCKTKKAA